MLCLTCIALLSNQPARDPAPPTWPQTFSAAFVENIGLAPNVSNHGAWFYDDPNRRSRFDHGAGQLNNFCACADNTTNAACSLFFPPSGALWAHFPDSGSCCRVCEPGLGCSTLKPDWLATNSSFVGEERHGGLDCLTWEKQGAVATDVWSQTAAGRACQYREHFPFGPPQGVWHFLNFSEWSTLPPDPALFELPSSCLHDCPRTFGKTCG
jgi:hypothetical protein